MRCSRKWSITSLQGRQKKFAAISIKQLAAKLCYTDHAAVLFPCFEQAQDFFLEGGLLEQESGTSVLYRLLGTKKQSKKTCLMNMICKFGEQCEQRIRIKNDWLRGLVICLPRRRCRVLSSGTSSLRKGVNVPS